MYCSCRRTVICCPYIYCYQLTCVLIDWFDLWDCINVLRVRLIHSMCSSMFVLMMSMPLFEYPDFYLF